LVVVPAGPSRNSRVCSTPDPGIGEARIGDPQLGVRPSKSEDAEMKPRITILTLGVDNLEKAVQFYRDGLGLETEGIIGTEFEHGQVAFFDLQSGLKLALFARHDLAHDAQIPVSDRSPTELSIGHNVGSATEVDAVMLEASNAGAKIIKPAQKTFWGGYAGYFQDPDGHLWEVAWNPFMKPSA
jgi:catechol 2,3-dioxygenase-like lactoylglutathione lyase family enzyme